MAIDEFRRIRTVWQLHFKLKDGKAIAQIIVLGPVPLARHLAPFNMMYCYKMERVGTEFLSPTETEVKG